MHEAWMKDPKLRSDTAKRQFLTDLVGKGKQIGVKKTVEILLPCLVECFNSDEIIHPDIYDAHAHLLFTNLGPLIDFLGKEGKSKMPKKIE